MSKISAVIIDDEFFNRKLVTFLIEKLNSAFKIEGEAENVREGFNVINTVKPKVVFLDIKMPDGSGFDLLKKFSAIDFEVVFITGFDQYALMAFDFNALDYVLKPIDSDKFKTTLDKVQARIENASVNLPALKNILEIYNAENAVITKIPIQYNNKVVLLSLDDIMYINNEGKNVVITTSESLKYNCAKQLKDFEFILENFPNHIRINKDTYINVNFVSSYSKGFDYLITMKDGSVFETLKKQKEEIVKVLKTRS